MVLPVRETRLGSSSKRQETLARIQGSRTTSDEVWNRSSPLANLEPKFLMKPMFLLVFNSLTMQISGCSSWNLSTTFLDPSVDPPSTMMSSKPLSIWAARLLRNLPRNFSSFRLGTIREIICISLMFVYQQLLNFAHQINELSFLHGIKLGINAQAPVPVPKVIPEENQESGDHHPQESSSPDHKHEVSENSLIKQKGEDCASGSHNHCVDHVISPKIYPGYTGAHSGDPVQQFTDSPGYRIRMGICPQIMMAFLSSHVSWIPIDIWQ